jgi:predicted transcriptional regulator
MGAEKMQFSIRLAPDLIERLDKLADETCRPRNNLIEFLLINSMRELDASLTDNDPS